MKYQYLIAFIVQATICQEYTTLIQTFYYGQPSYEYITQGWQQSSRTEAFNYCGQQYLDFDYISTSGPDTESYFQITLNSTQPHSELRVSYDLICLIYNLTTGDDMFQLSIDGNIAQNHLYNISTVSELQICNSTKTPFSSETFYTVQNQIYPHNSTTADIKFKFQEETNLCCDLYNVHIEQNTQPPSPPSPPQPEPQYCFDQIGNITDANGDTLMENNCTAYIENDEQRFNFTVAFQDPYQLDTQCFNLQVKFQNQTLDEGTEDLDEWQFDSQLQQISWKIKLDDFLTKYNCSDSDSTDDAYVWLCHYQVDIYYNNTLQQEYKAKIQVTINRGANSQTSIVILPNIVEGACCENQLNVTTVLNICPNMSCSSYLSAPFQFERGEAFYVEQSISNLEFDHYYLKYIETKLGPILLQVLEYDGSTPGKLRLKLQANIALSGSLLQVVSQLHNEEYSPLSGQNRRLLGGKEEAVQQLNSNQYKIASYEQVDVVQENNKNDDNQQEDTVVIQKVVVKQVGKDQKQQIILLGIAGLLIFITLTFGSIVAYKIKKSKKEEQYKEQEENNQPRLDTEQCMIESNNA